MKLSLIAFLFLLTLLVSQTSLANASALLNRIEGQVYNPDRLPVADAYVELVNAVESTLSRTKTNAAGRFSFFGVPNGRFVVKVIPAGTNYLQQSQEVELASITSTGTDSAYIDFYLVYDKRAINTAPDRPAEAVFVQDVPPNARRLYESGANDLKKNWDKGVEEIEQAVAIFPDYFDALARLGQEYNSHQKYDKAYPYLLKAIDVNQRSYNSYYGLAYSFYQLKQIPAALKAAQATVTLNGNSADAQLLYGTLLRVSGNFQDAEKTLLKAKSIAKKPNPEVYYQLALVYNKLNRNQEAASELETYLKIYPDSPDKKKVQELIDKLKNAKKSS